jgi:hypothetical protein
VDEKVLRTVGKATQNGVMWDGVMRDVSGREEAEREADHTMDR